ncbi:MAG: histidine phosphatase family protein [Gammaproteobacteria bacterium]|nr:histidine phosphatase family protein [Gammaproteobacteria bacterium]
MTSILLLRHGQIPANVQGRWHGSTDSALTWRGRRQIKRTARHLASRQPAVSAIYSSPLQRCVATAEASGKRLGLEVVVREELREYAIGEWEDMPFRRLHEQHDFIRQATADQDFAPPGGESLRGVAERMVPAVSDIHDAHPGDATVLLVGHGAALAVALASLIDQDPTGWTDYLIANCSLTELVLSPAPYVNFFNSTQHL